MFSSDRDFKGHLLKEREMISQAITEEGAISHEDLMRIANARVGYIMNEFCRDKASKMNMNILGFLRAMEDVKENSTGEEKKELAEKLEKYNSAMESLENAVSLGIDDRSLPHKMALGVISVAAALIAIAGIALIIMSCGIAPAALVAAAAGIGITASTTVTVAGTTLGVGAMGGAAVTAGYLMHECLGYKFPPSWNLTETEDGKLKIKSYNALELFNGDVTKIQNHITRTIKYCNKCCDLIDKGKNVMNKTLDLVEAQHNKYQGRSY